jgi:hypothetical protein
MQIHILSGMRANEEAEFVESYPLNLEPIALDNGISKGQLRATAGAVQIGTGPGTDRGAINWRDRCFRVMGTKLVEVSASGGHTVIGDVGGSGSVRFDYSFDRLGIRSGTSLWYYDLVNLTQVTDVDQGQVHDMMWIDGYWMTTDGNSVVVTELSDPYQILPLKYGSAEEDPDMVTGLMKVRNEPYIIGRHTIQVFRNIGGNGFPFTTVRGATIPFGCVSATAKAYYGGSFAFVGGPRPSDNGVALLGIYVATQGDAAKISTRAVDQALAAVQDPTAITMETRSYKDEERLFVHLPEETWVYCGKAGQKSQTPVWYRACSGGSYRIRNAVSAYGKIICGDSESAAIGELREDVSAHFGVPAEWEFLTSFVYNEGKGGLCFSVELVGLPGRAPHGEGITAFLSMTRDGTTWSVERSIPIGNAGERRKRMQWRPRTKFTNYLGLRFRGVNHALSGFARCEADIRPLAA